MAPNMEDQEHGDVRFSLLAAANMLTSMLTYRKHQVWRSSVGAELPLFLLDSDVRFLDGSEQLC